MTKFHSSVARDQQPVPSDSPHEIRALAPSAWNPSSRKRAPWFGCQAADFTCLLQPAVRRPGKLTAEKPATRHVPDELWLLGLVRKLTYPPE